MVTLKRNTLHLLYPLQPYIIHKIIRYKNFTFSTIYWRIANCTLSVIYSCIYVQKWKVQCKSKGSSFFSQPCFVLCDSQPIGILKFKNGLEITNQTHILFGELFTLHDTCWCKYKFVSNLEIIELLQLNSVSIYLILYKI